MFSDGTGAEDFEFVVFDSDESGRDAFDGASVFDVGDVTEEGGGNFAGVGNGGIAGEVGTGGDERTAKGADGSDKVGMVGDADADEWAVASDEVGDARALREEDGERAGEEVLDDVFFERGEVGDVGAEHLEVAREKKEGFLWIAMFGSENLLDGDGIFGVSEDTIDGVGGCDDKVAAPKFGGDAGEVERGRLVHESIIALVGGFAGGVVDVVMRCTCGGRGLWYN